MKFYYEALDWQYKKQEDQSKLVILDDEYDFDGNTKFDIPRIEMAFNSWTFNVDVYTREKRK